MSARCQVLALYRQLLRESSKFPNYNYRSYALQRVRDAFREHRAETRPEQLQALLNTAQESLELVQRQVQVGQLYRSANLVVEGPPAPGQPAV